MKDEEKIIMSERIKERIGDELYNQIIEKGIKETEFDLLDGYIPIQRFNEVNDKLKATIENIIELRKKVNKILSTDKNLFYIYKSNIEMLLHDKYNITDYITRNKIAIDILELIFCID